MSDNGDNDKDLISDLEQIALEKEVKRKNFGFILSQLLQKIYKNEPEITKENSEKYKNILKTVVSKMITDPNDKDKLDELIDTAINNRINEMIEEDKIQKRDGSKLRKVTAPIKNAFGLRVSDRGKGYVGAIPFADTLYGKTYDGLMNAKKYMNDDDSGDTRSTAKRTNHFQSSNEGLENQKKEREHARILKEKTKLEEDWEEYINENTTTNGGSKKKTRKMSKKERGRKSRKPKKSIKSRKPKKSKKSRKSKKH